MNEISKEEIKKIIGIVKFHYGFLPKEEDILNIDHVLKNNYIMLHRQRIVNELATRYAAKDLLKYRDKIGSQKFEEIWLTKIMFHYLTYASMSYRVGIPMGTICLCRTAIETGLREEIAERLMEGNPVKMMGKIKELEKKTLGPLIEDAECEDIITKNEIETIFQEFRSRNILDKFVHGNIVWIKEFIKTKYKDAEVIGHVNELEKSYIIANSRADKIAIRILKCVYKIAEILYFKNLK